MTRAVRDRILKDVNGDNSDHLRNHVHLTNCIHVKNHMHKHSPILSDRGLMRDLVALQRSRSLRDPSTSPQSWHSLSVVDMLFKRGETNEMVSERRSIGLENSDNGHVNRRNEGKGTAMTARSSKHLSEGKRTTRKEESSRRDLVQGSVSGKSEFRAKNVKPKFANRQHKDVISESDDDAASSHNHVNKSPEQIQNCGGEPELKFPHANGVNRTKRHNFRSASRDQPSVTIQHDAAVVKKEISVASNSISQGRASQKHHIDEGVEEQHDQRTSGFPGNGCGIPWNWSRIHNRGKSFLDMGQSLSCGLSEPRMKKGGPNIRGTCLQDMSENSRSSINNEREVLPLLLDAPASQGSVDHAPWPHEYSGGLGIFADNLMKQETDSDLISEGRSCVRHEFGQLMHQNLTQKYMPRTFRDLIGQPLVVQALSNAIAKRKIGLLYLFYGPQGTGKTSCARIFARALNCLSPEQHSKPCEVCKTCIGENSGKIRGVREIGPVSNSDMESIAELLEDMKNSRRHSHYRVFIFSECDTLSPDCWNAILKAIDLAPRRVVFILVCSNLDAVPRVMISRCQKFSFHKLKDADIIYSLQWIANKEGLDIEMDAVKLIASRSDGSLRDAEMTLEQLGLLGKQISLGLVQELVGLISDEKLVDLLDLALSADTVNAVKNLRDIIAFGVDPLTLMSQLATVITDILAGSFDFSKGRSKKKFFRHQALLKHEMERLRQALKTLSEAEKQLRASTDRMTWLTAALLQLAPDQQYIAPNSSDDVSSQLGFDNVPPGEKPRKSNVDKGKVKVDSNGRDNERRTSFSSDDKGRWIKARLSDREIEEVWLEVLEKIPVNVIRAFMYQEANLVSVSYGESAHTVELHFNSPLLRSKAEKFRMYILQAFESVLRSPVTIDLRCGGPNLLHSAPDNDRIRTWSPAAAAAASTSGIKRTSPSPRNAVNNRVEIKGSSSNQRPSYSYGDGNRNRSLVRGKISLAHMIRQIDGYTQNNGWSKRKAVSIAEKLEQQNLRLESKSRRLRCWNHPKNKLNKKLSKWRTRAGKPTTLLKFILCGTGRCLSWR